MLRPFTKEEIEFLKSRNLKYIVNDDEDVADLDYELGEILDREHYKRNILDYKTVCMIFSIIENVDDCPEEYRGYLKL